MPDALASTGSFVLLPLLLAAVLLAGGLLLRRRGSRGVLALGLVAALGLLAAVSVPAAPAQASAGPEVCPAGYHWAGGPGGQKPSSTPSPATTQAAVPSAPATPQLTPTPPAPTASPAPSPGAPLTCSASEDSQMADPTTFSLAPDGSSGLTTPGGRLVNMDVAKATVRAYYGAGKDGIANKTSSPYITEVTGIVAAQKDRLQADYDAAVAAGQKPALVFDVDDTTLWTYDMEDGHMRFNFTVAEQTAYLSTHDLPATPAMVDYVNTAKAMGYTIIGLTGRGEAQRALTKRNLDNVGYQGFTSELTFLKPTTVPSYLSCPDGKCTTVQYKAGTRAHIEQDLGYTIVANWGDQWSDLQGGHAKRWVKLPNPVYYLPSPNLPDWEAADAAAGMAPRTTFTLAPDGSTGLTASGEDIPNIDVVKSTIRQYYGAGKDGVANKESSPYITETTAWTKQVTAGVAAQCRSLKESGAKPAITLDADDTTLWTYDMEDGVMHFHFTPAGQREYLTKNNMPATPGMVDLVKAAKEAGCEVIGLTGRAEDLEAATVANLDAEYGAGTFNHDLYFTKWTGKGSSVKPDYIRCAKEKCTTVEFKGGTRAHIENDLGYKIVANVGDQWSDLKGGHAMCPIKLPNPTYYLP